MKVGDRVHMHEGAGSTKKQWITQLEAKHPHEYELKLVKNVNNVHFWRNKFTAKELSKYYSDVYRKGKYVGSINTKYW